MVVRVAVSVVVRVISYNRDLFAMDPVFRFHFFHSFLEFLKLKQAICSLGKQKLSFPSLFPTRLRRQSYYLESIRKVISNVTSIRRVDFLLGTLFHSIQSSLVDSSILLQCIEILKNHMIISPRI